MPLRLLGFLAAATSVLLLAGCESDRALEPASGGAGSPVERQCRRGSLGATNHCLGGRTMAVNARIIRGMKVLARHQRAVDSAWGQVRPNVRAAINAAQMDIAILLRGDQRERYMS